MREIDKIASDLFDKIRSRFENVSTGDSKADSTDIPEKARFFSFEYTNENREPLMNITISIVNEKNMQILFSQISKDDLENVEKQRWYNWLKNLRLFAKRNNLTFDVRDYTRNNLEIRDLKQISKSLGTYDKSDVHVHESKMFGTAKSSYQDLGPVKLIIRHGSTIDETVHGARTRNIESIFVETQLGERFLLPFKKLTPARAMATHIRNGGIIQDDIGKTIVSMVNEMSNLSFFVRNMRNRTFENADTLVMVEASIERYQELHNTLSAIRGQKGYQKFRESYKSNEVIVEDDINLDELRERFVKKIFDDRLSEALPHVYKAYKNKKKAMENHYVSEFENWTERIAEGTWAVPEKDQDKEELRRLMDKPIAAGPNGDEAANLLYDIIGSDSLYDQFLDASKSENGPDTDVRPLIIDWLKEHGYESLATEFEEKISAQQPTPTDNQSVPQSPPATEQPPAVATPAQESVDEIRKLAGLTTLRKL